MKRLLPVAASIAVLAYPIAAFLTPGADPVRPLGVIFVVVMLAIYFIPATIAAVRRHHNATAILVANLAVGWTLIGWLVVLIWSFTRPNNPVAGVAA